MSNEPKEASAANKATRKANKIWLKRIRVFAGFLGMTLPWIALLGAYIFSNARPDSIPEHFWEKLSISETYYVTPALAGILTTAAVVLMSYKGYNLLDHVVTSISGLFGIMIVLFPCSCPMAEGDTLVGFFQLPAKVSDIIHCTSAVLFFILLAFNSLFLFTQGESQKNTNGEAGQKQNLSKEKRIKNIIFRVCGIGMLSVMILIPLPIQFFAKIFVVEAIALTFFGIGWLVKGEVFGLLADKKQE